MKPQDILFIILLLGLVFTRKPKILVWAGLACFIISMPLFAKWIFFTAERLVMYGAGFLVVACVMFWFKYKK
jgi:hypothetical protein